MARLFAYPMHVQPNGEFATVEDGDDYYAQELAMLMRTVPGERNLVPEYGIEDFTSTDTDSLVLESKIAMFGPPVDILTVEVLSENDATIVNVEFEPIAPDYFDDGADDDSSDYDDYYDEDPEDY